MAKTTVQTLIPNVLGFVEQSIKNVQETASSILPASAIKYRYPVLSKSTQTYSDCLEQLDNAFQVIYEKLENIKLQDSDGKEISVIDLLDNGKTGITFKVFSDLPEKAMDLLTDGSMYSTATKDHLIENSPLDDDGKKILSQSDFESKSDKPAKKAVASVQIVTGSDIL